MHICTDTVAIVHKCTILPQLMWVFFEPKCIKRLPFSILHKFTQPDVIALRSYFIWYCGLFLHVWDFPKLPHLPNVLSWCCPRTIHHRLPSKVVGFLPGGWIWIEPTPSNHLILLLGSWSVVRET